MAIVCAADACCGTGASFGCFDHLLLGVVAAFAAEVELFFISHLLFSVFTIFLMLMYVSFKSAVGSRFRTCCFLSLAAVIAACDSAAYFVGRSVGGPKLLVLLAKQDPFRECWWVGRIAR